MLPDDLDLLSIINPTTETPSIVGSTDPKAKEKDTKSKDVKQKGSKKKETTNTEADKFLKDSGVHIRIRQRGRKHLTHVHGLPKTLPIEDIVKDMKKQLACIGLQTEDEETGEQILRFSGDQRDKIRDYLVKKKYVDATNITLHGY